MNEKEYRKRAERLPASIKSAMRDDCLVNTLGNMYLRGSLDYASFLESAVIEMSMRDVRAKKQIYKLMSMQPGSVVFMDNQKEPQP